MVTETFSKIKNRVLLILLAVLFACTSAFFLTACGDEENEYTEKDYSFEWTDDAKIVNGSFEFGTNGVTLDQYPYNSASNWSLSVDNSAQSSLITSGIVNTKTGAWDELLSTLYGDVDFIAYAEKKWNFDVDDIKTANPTWTEAQVKSHIVETYFNETNFANPKAPVGAKGDKVYMLNNYPSVSALGGIGQGTAQRLVSSTSIALEKGSYGKITVFVQTKNLAHFGTADDIGANIRLSNTVATTKQADYRISGINTETSGVAVDANGWAKYEIFVKADDFIDCSIIVELGLGYGNGASNKTKDYCEGTAYFDDITFEKVEKADYEQAITSGAAKDVFKYETSSKEAFEKVAGNKTVFVYSMDVNESIALYANTYYNEISTASISGALTLGSDGTTIVGSGSLDKAYTAETCDYSDKLLNATVNGSSYTLSFGSYNNPVVSVPAESYANVVFYLKSNLGEFSKNNITVVAYDVNKDLTNGNYAYAKAPRITINPTYEQGKWCKVSFTLNNNFPEKDANGKYADVEHAFFFQVIIGPSDVLATSSNYQFATGNLVMSVPEIATGKAYNYQRENYVSQISPAGNTYYTDYDIKEELPENKTAFNDYYSLAYSISDAKEALFSAYLLDFTEKSDAVEYSMNVAPSAVGAILSGPANIDGFTGISADHGYINSQSNNFVVNERSGNGNTEGIAGVINTKYISSYTSGSEILSALNHTDTKDAQPLMIYNATSNAYGFIGESLPLEAGTPIHISVKVRVVGTASAYIYLVDTSSETKKVMSITVPVNTDGVNYLPEDQIQTKTGTMAFKIKSSMMRADEDGWVTVNFYIGAGNTAKNFRLELWNGARDGSDNSQGYVFFDEVITSGAFSESNSGNYLSAFTEGALLDANIYDKGVVNEALLYKRPLDETEIEYNNDDNRKNEAVSYSAKYVWVKTPTTAYAIFNSLEYDAVDPYASEVEEEATDSCAAETDPATFWMQFSSILLGVALAFALIALIVKGYINRKKANANDAKSHYNVSSRFKVSKDKKSKEKEEIAEEVSEETVEETSEENIETTEETVEEQTENAETTTLDDYVYGDVQDFGSDDIDKE